MAASLIDTMTEDFDPDQYHDSYREALEAVVRAKVEGNDVVRPPGMSAPAVPKGEVADLTETLRASVAALKAGRDKPDKPKAAPAKRAPAKRAPAKRATAAAGKEAAEKAAAEPKAKAAPRRKASA